MGVFAFGEFGRNLACLSRPFAASADRPSNRDECSLAFETPDNAANEQRGVLGSALLEEEYVLLCLSARAITEAAQAQARHAPLQQLCATAAASISVASAPNSSRS